MLQKEHNLVRDCYEQDGILGDVMKGLHQLSHFIALEHLDVIGKKQVIERIKKNHGFEKI